MFISNNYVNIEILNSGYGTPCIDRIGYDNYNTAIPIPRTFFVSAHAPSKLNIRFKENGKYYINGMLNKTTGVYNDSIIYKIYQKHDNKILLENKISLIYNSIYFNSDQEYIFEINCDKNYGAHTLWNFLKTDENLSEIEKTALSLANEKSLDSKSEYSLFIQTCNPRKKMAMRCAVSAINNLLKLPKRIIICSIDDINDGGVAFPNCVEFWTGAQKIDIILNNAGLSDKCISHIFNGFKNSGNPNMWLKYVIPRLCMDDTQIIVADDDVAFAGHCKELLESDKYMTFMEDNDPFYGERTIDFYNKTYNTSLFAKIKPFVCAGMYRLNKSALIENYNPIFINDLILKSEHDTDEQSAVGMEIIKNRSFMTLKSPKYHHGGFVDQKVDLDKLELMHMQGRAVGWRYEENFINQYILPKNYE